MFNLLDTVVLDRDLPEHGLRRGDLDAVVDLHAPDGLEVEFVLASGKRLLRCCWTRGALLARTATPKAATASDVLA